VSTRAEENSLRNPVLSVGRVEKSMMRKLQLQLDAIQKLLERVLQKSEG